jgi:hypothetical protein
MSTFSRKLSLVLLATVAARAMAAPSVAALTTEKGWPRDVVFVPTKLFGGRDKTDQIILESNPRLYLYPDFDPRSDKILVVGMDGWGGRSENFIDTMRLGLKEPGLTRRLVVAAIQDPFTRGPRYQGQGDREHANVWTLESPSVPALYRFVDKIADELGHLRVYFMGYSKGSVAAPRAAVAVGRMAVNAGKKFTVEGAISLGTGSSVKGSALKELNQRVLFIVVPKQRAKEHKARRYDQFNRMQAEASNARLTDEGATSYLRYVESARRHIDWHWGLMSQCRYFKPNRYDDGRGYWPHYWAPNPDSWRLMAHFIQGKEPPANLPHVRTKCEHKPNPHNPDDPG